MTTTKSYDLLNRLTGITSAAGGSNVAVFNYANNTANQRTAITNVDSSRWVYQYDALGQVISGKKYWSDGTPVAGQQFEYAFDDIGNRKTTGTGGDQYGANLRSASYTNNSLNQITSRSVPGYVDVQGSATNTATVTVNNQPTYRFGDYFRAELAVTNTAAPVWFGVTNVAVINNGTNVDIVSSVTGNVSVAKSPESLSYDADGNLTSDSLWTNTWNAENRLVRTESSASVPSAARVRADWLYLPDGRWAERIVSVWNGSTFVTQSTNRFVWDGRALLAILNHTNGLSLSVVRGLDDASVMVLDSTTLGQPSTHFVCHDGNANVAGLVDATNGVESARYDYSPFGETLRASGWMAKANQIRFSGEWADDVTGDVKFLYRIYRPVIGWFLSRGPLGEEAGKGLNGFVQNDAVNHVDRFGLFKESDVGGRLLYSCNCGWLDSSHYRSRKNDYERIETALARYDQDRSKNVFSLFEKNGDRNVASTTLYGTYMLTYKGMITGKYRLELALGIFMDFEKRFESHQNDFGAFNSLSYSSFSVEDLPSDFLGFLQGAGVIDIGKLCQPLSPEESRRMVEYGNGPRENKSHQPVPWTYRGTKKVGHAAGAYGFGIVEYSDPKKNCPPCQGKDTKAPSVFSDYKTDFGTKKVKFLGADVTHGYLPGSW